MSYFKVHPRLYPERTETDRKIYSRIVHLPAQFSTRTSQINLYALIILFIIQIKFQDSFVWRLTRFVGGLWVGLCNLTTRKI
jgi:hypothetical protein